MYMLKKYLSSKNDRYLLNVINQQFAAKSRAKFALNRKVDKVKKKGNAESTEILH